MMSDIVIGVVKSGVVVPNVLIPEGAKVQIHLDEQISDVPLDLHGELNAWQQSNANTLDLGGSRFLDGSGLRRATR